MKTVALVVAVLLTGLAGLAVVGFVALLRMTPPRTPGGQAARILGLAATGTATALGAVGGVVGLVLGLGYPPTVAFAVLEAGCIGGALGLAIGAVAGVVLGAVHLGGARRA